MSGKAMAWSRTVKVGSSRAKHVLRELCIAQNDETGFCSPSIKSLVELTEMTESTVLKALAHLREAGFIEVKKRKTPSGWANCYSFPALEGTLKTEGTINVKGTLKTEDTLKTEGTLKFEGEGTLKSEGRGTLKFEGVKKLEKINKNVLAPVGSQIDFTLNTRNEVTRNEVTLTSTEEVNIPDGYDDLPDMDEKKGKAAKLACPYDEIVDLYHEQLPELNCVNKVLLSDSRKLNVKARWDFLVKDGEATTRKDGLALISRFFGCVRKQPFLLGANSRGWRADFDWLFKQANFIKVLEFKYVSDKTHRV